MNNKDYAGQKYEMLTFVRPYDRDVCKVMWELLCECGKTCYLYPFTVHSGKAKSCGCVESSNEFESSEEGKEYRRQYRREYRKKNKDNPSYKLRANVSRTIARALFQQGGSKKGSSFLQCLPWTVKDLKAHLEAQFDPWMNWNNYGLYDTSTWNDNDQTTWTWNMDHIIAQSDLPYSSMEEDNFQKCWALSNIRPLSSKRNNQDGSRRTRHKKTKDSDPNT
jgi:hypothetical protein